MTNIGNVIAWACFTFFVFTVILCLVIFVSTHPWLTLSVLAVIASAGVLVVWYRDFSKWLDDLF